MSERFFLLLLAWLFVIIQTSILSGQSVADENELVLFQVLQDAPQGSDIGSICCNMRFDFEQPRVSHVSVSYGGSDLWLKIDPAPQNGILRLTPILDKITLYYQRSGSTEWQETKTGDSVPFSDRVLATPYMAFELPGDSRSPVFVKVQQATAVTIQMQFSSKDDFFARQSSDTSLKTFLFGFVLAIVAYNLLFAGFVRDLAYLLNALTILSLLAFSLYLSGYGFAYFWRPYPDLSNVVIVSSLFSAITFGNGFLWCFIRERSEPFRKGWPFLIPVVIAACAMLALIVVPYWWSQRILLLCAGLTFVIASAIAIKRAVSGQTQARIILVPMGLAMIPGLLAVAFDKIFGFKTPWVGESTLEITLCLEAILFSLALAIRIRLVERDRQHVEFQNLALRSENLRKTMATQDAERQRFSKELHDGVGQNFLVVLGGLKKLLRDGQSNPWRPTIEATLSSATLAMEEIRRVSRDMHPAAIEHLGLTNALQSLAETMQQGTDLTIDTDMDFSEAKLNADQNLNIYRIIQECLSNVIRHAQATYCSLSVRETDGKLVIHVDDNGTGLPADAHDKAGLGFTSIDERVLALKGIWHLDLNKPEGTSIKVSLPFGPDKQGG